MNSLMHLVWTLTVAGVGIVPGPDGESAGVASLIEGVRTATALERPARAHELALCGPEAISETRRARDSASTEELKATFARATRWQLARKITPRLLEGYRTQLTFRGQYVNLLEEGPELIPALLALVDDTASDARLRLSACRALADALDPTLTPPGREAPLRIPDRDALLASLRRLYHDVLLAGLLREQSGILLAILGDTQAVDSELRRLEKRAASDDLVESTQSHLQLANLYYRIRQYDKAVRSYDRILAFYERFLELQVERGATGEALESWQRELALHYYNAACSSCLNQDLEKSRTLLRKAVKLDPSHAEHVDQDGDLLDLREDPGYAAFIRELRELAGS